MSVSLFEQARTYTVCGWRKIRFDLENTLCKSNKKYVINNKINRNL